mmetsp:Transcript_21521/g.39507  ORF Transcript_21521/g.39507 Transcript_21521/m.39507 type:complete len:208 (-) Transcript_21521:80-703(-)
MRTHGLTTDGAHHLLPRTTMTRAPALPLENLASPGPVEERAVNPAAAEVAAHQAATTTTTTHPHLYGVDPQPDGLTMAGAVPPLPLMRTTTMTRAPPLHLANPASLAEVEESLERVAEAASRARAAAEARAASRAEERATNPRAANPPAPPATTTTETGSGSADGAVPPNTKKATMTTMSPLAAPPLARVVRAVAASPARVDTQVLL